jgi:hypothetical protein
MTFLEFVAWTFSPARPFDAVPAKKIMKFYFCTKNDRFFSKQGGERPCGAVPAKKMGPETVRMHRAL